MLLPDDVISASILLCEKVLRETDEVVSAIRIVDMFQFRRFPDVPDNRQGVEMRILVLLKFKETSVGPHRIGLVLTRPDATREEPQYMNVSLAPPITPSTHIGLTVNAGVVVSPKQEGSYCWIVLLDDVELIKAPFTLLELKKEPVQQ